MSTISAVFNPKWQTSLKSFFSLCKPKVTAMIVFTAVIGMLLQLLIV